MYVWKKSYISNKSLDLSCSRNFKRKLDVCPYYCAEVELFRCNNPAE